MSEIVSLVRKDLGAVAAFRLVAQVKALPRTRQATMMMLMLLMMMREMRMKRGLGNVKTLPQTRPDQLI